MSSVSQTVTAKTAGTGLPTPVPVPVPVPPPTPVPVPVPVPTPVVVQPTPVPLPTPLPTPVISQPPTGPVVVQSTVYTPLQTAAQTQAQPGQTTLLLDTARWDLVLDANRNIALASPPYSMAQDVASAVRLFQGECWYDTTKGVPYFQRILGKQPPPGVLKNAIVQAATSVPSVMAATVYLAAMTNRNVTGQIQMTTTAGTTVTLTGTLQQTTPATGAASNQLTDEAGNPLTDEGGNILISVA